MSGSSDECQISLGQFVPVHSGYALPAPSAAWLAIRVISRFSELDTASLIACRSAGRRPGRASWTTLLRNRLAELEESIDSFGELEQPSPHRRATQELMLRTSRLGHGSMRVTMEMPRSTVAPQATSPRRQDREGTNRRPRSRTDRAGQSETSTADTRAHGRRWPGG